MRQLHNQHPVDIKPGEIGVTVRRGGKWSYVTDGEVIELCSGPTAQEQTPVGTGEVITAQLTSFANIPAKALEYEHEISSRVYSGLLASMRRAYGPEFDEDEVVTVLTYKRLT